MVKEDDLCEGKALGCMEINKLGIILFCELKGGLVTFKVESSRQLSVKETEMFKNVGIDGLRKESYCVSAIPTIACFSFLLHSQRNFDSNLFFSDFMFHRINLIFIINVLLDNDYPLTFIFNIVTITNV